MSDDQGAAAEGGGTGGPTTAPLPSLPRLPETSGRGDPQPTVVPVGSGAPPPAAAPANGLSFHQMLAAHQHAAQQHSGRRGARSTRRRPALGSFVVMLLVIGGLAFGGYRGYLAYEARNGDPSLPAFAAIKVPYDSFTVDVAVTQRADVEPGEPPQMVDAALRIRAGRGSNNFEVTASIDDPTDPLTTGQASGILDKRGFFVQAPDGSWYLFTQPGAFSYEMMSPFAQLLTWDEVVPDELRRHVEVLDIDSESTADGDLTTYQLIIDMYEFATTEPDAYERWVEDGFLRGTDDADDDDVLDNLADLYGPGYALTLTVDEGGLVRALNSDARGESFEAVWSELSAELFAPELPATWTELDQPL